MGAGLILLPIYLWLASDREWDWLTDYRLVGAWSALVAILVISNLATYSWGSFRPKLNVRLIAIVVIALLGAALVTAPWETLSVAALLYILSIPFSIVAYARVKKRRAESPAPVRAVEPGTPVH